MSTKLTWINAASAPPGPIAAISKLPIDKNALTATNDKTVADRRTSDRKKIGFDTLVDFGLTHSVPWNITDLGLGGAFVEMDTSDLKPGKIIEFLLRYKLRGRLIELRLPAEVTDIEQRGVAFKFGAYDDATRSALNDLLDRMP